MITRATRFRDVAAARPGWARSGAAPGHEEVRVADDGSLDMETLVARGARFLAPEQALSLGRWLVETFGEAP